MDKQRLQAIEGLQISNDCIMSKMWYRRTYTGMLTKPRSNRIDALQKQIKWIEQHYLRSNNTSKDNDLKQLKQELAELLEEYAKADKLRCLPLYRCRITGWKFVLYVPSVMVRSTYMHVIAKTKSEIQKSLWYCLFIESY